MTEAFNEAESEDFHARMDADGAVPTIEELRREFRVPKGLYDQLIGPRGVAKELAPEDWDKLIQFFDNTLPYTVIACRQMPIEREEDKALIHAAVDTVAIFVVQMGIRLATPDPLEYGKTLGSHFDNFQTGLMQFLTNMARVDLAEGDDGGIGAEQQAAAKVLGKLDEIYDQLSPEQQKQVDALKAQAKEFGVPLV